MGRFHETMRVEEKRECRKKFGRRRPPMIGRRRLKNSAIVADDKSLVFLSVSDTSKISNMSKNGGRPMNTSFIGRSCRQNLSVSIHHPITSR